MIDTRTMSNPNAQLLKGLKAVRTAEGHHCNRIDGDNWEIVETGVMVRRV